MITADLLQGGDYLEEHKTCSNLVSVPVRGSLCRDGGGREGPFSLLTSLTYFYPALVTMLLYEKDTVELVEVTIAVLSRQMLVGPTPEGGHILAAADG